MSARTFERPRLWKRQNVLLEDPDLAVLTFATPDRRGSHVPVMPGIFGEPLELCFGTEG